MFKNKIFLPLLAASSMLFAGTSFAEDSKTEVDHTAQCINDSLNVLGTNHVGQFESFRRTFSPAQIESRAQFIFDLSEGAAITSTDSETAVKGLVGIYAYLEGVITVGAGSSDVSAKDIAIVSAFTGASCGAFSYSAIHCVLSENTLPFDVSSSVGGLNLQTMGRQCYICPQQRSTIVSGVNAGAQVSFKAIPVDTASVPKISSTTTNDHFTKAQISELPNYFTVEINSDVCNALIDSSITLVNVDGGGI